MLPYGPRPCHGSASGASGQGAAGVPLTASKPDWKMPSQKDKNKNTNSKNWCDYCRIYVYNNKISKTHHENSPQHKAALQRFVQRVQREENQEQQLKRKFAAKTGVLLDCAPGAGKSSFYSSSSAIPAPGKPQLAQIPSVRNQLASLPSSVGNKEKRTKILGVLPENLQNRVKLASDTVLLNQAEARGIQLQPDSSLSGDDTKEVEEGKDYYISPTAESGHTPASEGTEGVQAADEDLPLISYIGPAGNEKSPATGKDTETPVAAGSDEQQTVKVGLRKFSKPSNLRK